MTTQRTIVWHKKLRQCGRTDTRRVNIHSLSRFGVNRRERLAHGTIDSIGWQLERAYVSLSVRASECLLKYRNDEQKKKTIHESVFPAPMPTHPVDEQTKDFFLSSDRRRVHAEYMVFDWNIRHLCAEQLKQKPNIIIMYMAGRQWRERLRATLKRNFFFRFVKTQVEWQPGHLSCALLMPAE